jgi:uncharacterized membrane protein
MGARAAFVDLGVGRLNRRNGILVYVSLLEKAVDIVPDAGVNVTTIGPAWDEALGRLEAAVAAGDLDAFDGALRSLGPALERILPREEIDVNELPDEALVE